jgi:hypothetical protein
LVKEEACACCRKMNGGDDNHLQSPKPLFLTVDPVVVLSSRMLVFGE